MNNTATQLKGIYNDMVNMLGNGNMVPDHANSLFKGPWGVLLFMFYYEQYADDQADHATAFLEKLYADFAPGKGDDYSFCTGHAGPFWLLDHLNRHDFLELDMDLLAADFIDAAIVQSNLQIAARNFDFLYGSTGICNFLLNFTGRANVKAYLEQFVNGLSAVSEMTDKGRSFPVQYLHDEHGGTYVNSFSLAHGACSLLIMLAKIYQAGIARNECRRLITESIAFILQHKNNIIPGSLSSLYPGILDGRSSYSRLAWCYGDLNVALALWQCGKTLEEESWMQEALHIMHYNTRRNTDETAGIVDNCICHGASGIAAFYRKFWFETGDTAFYNCAAHWHNKAAERIAFSDVATVHGIRVWQGKDKQWDYGWDLLDGCCGVGLSLLSHTQETPLSWDECLLLS